tara:strand:- start:185 stop:397 length:213 start_codon:yes stop_codon:yes gene_type:complete
LQSKTAKKQHFRLGNASKTPVLEASFGNETLRQAILCQPTPSITTLPAQLYADPAGSNEALKSPDLWAKI